VPHKQLEHGGISVDEGRNECWSAVHWHVSIQIFCSAADGSDLWLGIDFLQNTGLRQEFANYLKRTSGSSVE
jgi:hypothetical protein